MCGFVNFVRNYLSKERVVNKKSVEEKPLIKETFKAAPMTDKDYKDSVTRTNSSERKKKALSFLDEQIKA